VDWFGIILNFLALFLLYVTGPVGGLVPASRDLDPTYRIIRKLGIPQLETNWMLRMTEKAFRMGSTLVGNLEICRLLVLWLIVHLVTIRMMKSSIQSICLSNNEGIDGKRQRKAEIAKYNCLRLIVKTMAPVLSLPIAIMMLCLGNIIILGIFRLIRLRSIYPSAFVAVLNVVFMAGVLAGMNLAIGTAVECKEISEKMLDEMRRECNQMKGKGIGRRWEYKMAKSLRPIEWHLGTGIWGDFVFSRIHKGVKSGYFYWVWDRTIAALLLVI
jgi:hypothetical protein